MLTFRMSPPASTQADYRALSLVVGAAFFMEQLDATIIAPVLPEMAQSFGVAPLSLNLTLTIYLLCNVIFIPASGYLASRFGARRVFKAALALFMFSSLVCGLASDLMTLVVARALQGVSGALMVPVGRNVIVQATRKSDLVMALAWMVTPAMIGPVLGPPLGGLIATYLSWHWIFFINLPIGLAGYIAASRYMPELKPEVPRRFDMAQWLLLSGVLGSLVAMLELVRHPQTSPWAYGALAGVLVLSLWRLSRQLRGDRERLLDFSLLRFKTFSVSFWQGSLMRVGYGALPFLMPLFLQLGLGYSALDSGLVLLASGGVALVTKTITAKILRRFGFPTVLTVNGFFCAVGLALCAFVPLGSGLGLAILAVSLGGFFRAVQFNALAAIAYAELSGRQTAPATSLNTTFQQLAVMLGISLAVIVVDLSARWHDRAAPAAADFAWALGVLAVIVLASVACSFKLPPDAGTALSGHRGRQR